MKTAASVTVEPLPRGRPAWEIPLVVALLAAAVWAACFAFPAVWIITGIGEPDKPFLDLRNLISAGESLQRGLDPHVTNPLDPYHRLHGFSDWWLVMGKLGVTGSDLVWIGTLLLVLVLVGAGWVSRPTTWREGRDLLLALVSPPLLMAAHRANHDLVAFVLMCGSLVALRRGGAVARSIAIVLLAVSAVLKYFPLAAVVLLIEARTRRELLRWIVLYVGVLLVAWPSLERSLGVAAANQPAPAWLYAFGAPVIFRNLEWSHANLLGWLITAGLAAVILLRPRPATDPAAAMRPSPEFLGAAIMLVGCFLHGSSYAYKWVFSLWLLPWWWGHADGPGNENSRRWQRRLWLAVLWFEGLAAIAINLAANYAGLAATDGLRLLAVALTVAQILNWALMVWLARELWIYALGQWQRWRLA